MAIATKQSIAELYVANFGRAADAAGLNYWVSDGTSATTGLTDIQDIAKSFADSTEFKAAYDTTDRTGTIQKMYENIFNRTADAAGLQYWNDSGIALDSMIIALLNGALGTDATYMDNRTDVALAFADAGLTNVGQAYSIMHDVTGDRATATSAIAAINAEAGISAAVATVHNLTSSVDTVTGSSASDTFESYLAQNSFSGGVSNSLSSADKLDGAGGADSLFAQIVPEFFGVTGDHQIDIQARTTSIETVEFEARDTGSNNIADTLVTVDAKDMTGVTKIGSKFSDGDLKIENLTTSTDSGSINAVSSMTITMDHTDNMNSDTDASDLTVLFDEDYLTPTTSYGVSGIEFKMMNQDAYDANNGADRLDGVYVRKMAITLEGVKYDLAPLIQEDAATGLGAEFKTETALVAHLNAVVLPALKLANPGVAAMDSLVFSIGSTWNDNNVNRIGDKIVLSVSNQYSLTIGSTDLELAQAEGVPNDYASNRIERADNYTGANSESISVNVNLEKVGRDGEGGNLVVGGKDQTAATVQTDVDQTDGIPIINVTVTGDVSKPSNLGRITSTNDKLTTLNVTSETRTDSSYAALTVRGQAGDLDMQAGTNPFGGTLATFNANSFKGNLNIGQTTDALNIDTFTATGGGNVLLNESITQADGTDSSTNWAITTGAGADTITVALDGDAVDAIHESFTVATGSANDTVTVTMGTGVSYNTMSVLKNLHINTGAGDDKVLVNNSATFDIVTADGSDFVEIDSVATTNLSGAATIGNTTGVQTFADRVLYNATVTVSFAGFEETVTIPTTSSNKFVADQVMLNEAIVKAIAANPELAKLITTSYSTGDEAMVITSNIDGINSLDIAIHQGELYSTQAALTASNNSTGILINSGDVTALRQGLIKTETVNSSVLEDATEIATWTTAAANNWYGSIDNTGSGDNVAYATAQVKHDTAESIHDDAKDVIDSGNAYLNTDIGANDTTGANYSTINVGAGAHDIIVLDSDVNSMNTIVINQTFGKISVVNFFDTSTGNVSANASSVGDHSLDFGSYLNNQTDPSTSTVSNTDSAVAIAGTVNVVNGAESYSAQDHGATNTNIALANGIDVLRFDSSVAATADTFANLTSTDLFNALNGNGGTDNYGNLTNNLLDAQGNIATLVGDERDHIVMVENDLNEGEYKVFHLTSDNTVTAPAAAGDFAAASELGTLDFGASVNFMNAGSTLFKTTLATALNTADGVTGGGSTGGGSTGGGSTGGTTTTVSATGINPYTHDMSGDDTTTNDNIIDFPTSNVSISNTDLTDGQVTLTWNDGTPANSATVTLTGLTTTQDQDAYSVAQIDTIFGAGTIA